MEITGYISDYDGQSLTIVAPFTDSYLLEKRQINECEVRLMDGRTRSMKQLRTIYMLIRAISMKTGYLPEEAKQLMKYSFMIDREFDYFSVSDVDMTTARAFITYLIDFCIEHDIPCEESLLHLAEDVSRYLYMCLAHRKCAICGKRADVHHEDAIGMGRDRKKISHIGIPAIALCRSHHTEAETIGKQSFFEKYHVYGIPLDEYLCKILKLRIK